MKIQILAHLLDERGQPLAGLKVEAQAFLPGKGWSSMVQDGTDNKGQLVLWVEGTPKALAPAVRLVSLEGRQTSVLARVAEYRGTQDTLTIDFGKVGPGAVEDPKRASESEPSLIESRVAAVYAEKLAAETLERERLERRLKEEQQSLTTLEGELQRLRQERDALDRSLEQLRGSAESSPTVDGLAGAMSSALRQARELGGLELAGAEIRLRGIISEGGARFHPLDVAEAREIRPENVSELVLRLDPPRLQEEARSVVPDLIGQTAGPARRLALGAGLSLEVIEEASSRHPDGAIIAQVPEPGSPVALAEGRVSVVVAVSSREEGAS